MKPFKLWFPVVVWAGLIFYVSGIPHLETGLAYDFILRKLAHVAEYFILTLLLCRAFKNSFGLGVFYSFICPAGLALLYAVSDEIHQRFVPGRNGCVRDVLIDAGGILGFYAARKILRRFHLNITKI